MISPKDLIPLIYPNQYVQCFLNHFKNMFKNIKLTSSLPEMRRLLSNKLLSFGYIKCSSLMCHPTVQTHLGTLQFTAILKVHFQLCEGFCKESYSFTMFSAHSTVCSTVPRYWQWRWMKYRNHICAITRFGSAFFFKYFHAFCCIKFSSFMMIQAVHSITLIATSDVNLSLGICGKGSKSGYLVFKLSTP